MEENSHLEIYRRIAGSVDLAGLKVLEVGCGDGRITEHLVLASNSVAAIDPDQASISAAEQKNLDAEFQTGSGETLNFPDGFFDLVVFTLSLHHQNSGLALKEAARVLKQDGAILVIEPLEQGELEQVCSFVHDEAKEKRDAQQAIKHSGLTIQHSQVFHAQWRFQDLADLLQWLTEYYQRDLDDNLVGEIEGYLGGDVDKPFTLRDTMIIQSLTKGQVDG
jgi:ubiquinone/menaquinone biosynthesis C-methylase UbiE